jgi:hypothetical protein
MLRSVVATLFIGVNVVVPQASADDGPITYTLEPFDFDGHFGLGVNLTQLQLGGTLCPCVKVPYVSDGMPWNNQGGADNVDKLMQKGTIKAGDTVMGFSLGIQVLSLYLSQHVPPSGVRFVLVGDTFERNQELVDKDQGVPWDIANEVIMIANQYDWSDDPDKRSAPGYRLAIQNQNAARSRIHSYVKARLGHPANVIRQRGNIRAELVPTIKLPINDWMREKGNNDDADDLDQQQRALIDDAYERPGPTPEQLAASIDEQVSVPPEPPHQTPEPVADVG